MTVVRAFRERDRVTFNRARTAIMKLANGTWVTDDDVSSLSCVIKLIDELPPGTVTPVNHDRAVYCLAFVQK